MPADKLIAALLLITALGACVRETPDPENWAAANDGRAAPPPEAPPASPAPEPVAATAEAVAAPRVAVQTAALPPPPPPPVSGAPARAAGAAPGTSPPTLPAAVIVQPGDTLFRLALCAGLDVATIARANDLAPTYEVRAGQVLAVPPAIRPRDCLPGQDLVAAPTALPAPVAGMPPPPRAEPGAVVPARAAARFLWPVRGKLISGFGPKPGNRHNDGINVAAAAGSEVRAAENGIVVYVGNELAGYGNLLLIRHAADWTSAYAHNAEILVGKGETVQRGQVVAMVGATGNVDSPQSHFELRRGTKAVDPIDYLSNH